jgi:hypothetical protein
VEPDSTETAGHIRQSRSIPDAGLVWMPALGSVSIHYGPNGPSMTTSLSIDRKVKNFSPFVDRWLVVYLNGDLNYNAFGER